MPRRKFIDKKTATTFTLVHRAQNDPRIHDADAPDMVFKEVGAPNLRQPAANDSAASSASSAGSAASAVVARSKAKSRSDLEDEFGLSVRPNEGEAATYGVFYDDSAYDYMQHMRELGASGDAFFVEAGGAKKGKGKETMRLEDALRGVGLDGGSVAGVGVGSGSGSVVSRDARDLFGEDLAPSGFVRRTTYQDQQNVPDALAGFQPDMDPRLREVLEALEDEAYVDDDDELFGELAGDGLEVDPVEWQEGAWDEGEGGGVSIGQYEEDEGWETDDTIKAGNSPKTSKKKTPAPLGDLPAPDSVPGSAEEGDDAWLHEFNKFKKDAKVSKAAKAAAPSDLTGASALTAGGRRKKRKGALTSTSGYSMTSSALHRTEGLTLLDERFEKIEEEYATEDFPDDASMVSGMSKMSGLSKMSGMSGMSGISGMSEVPQLRSDFDSIMDDFLGGYSMSGKRRVKKGGYQTGLEQLDEIRKGLGPAKVRAQKA